MPQDLAATPLPEADKPLLLRTDFTDDHAWLALPEEIDDGEESGAEHMTFVADPAHQGLTVRCLVDLVPDGCPHPVLVVADDVTFSSDDHTLLVVDLAREPGQTFRAEPDAIPTVINNLWIGNKYFSDYVDSLTDNGVYRISARHRAASAALRSAGRRAEESPRATNAEEGPRVPNKVAAPRRPAQAPSPASRVLPAQPARPRAPRVPPVPPVPGRVDGDSSSG